MAAPVFQPLRSSRRRLEHREFGRNSLLGALRSAQHAGYRQIVDLSEPGGSFIHAGAQCGHFLARRGDYMRDWASNRYRPMRFDRDSVERNAAGTLLLEPSRTP
jgi:hypothetical protein